jgi:hypothetical protein
MKTMTLNFTPHAMGNTAVMNATAASSSVAVDTKAPSLYVYNAGTNIAFVRWTQGASTATVTDLPIPAGSLQVFSKGPADTFSAICSSGLTTTLYVSAGAGS